MVFSPPPGVAGAAKRSFLTNNQIVVQFVQFTRSRGHYATLISCLSGFLNCLERKYFDLVQESQPTETMAAKAHSGVDSLLTVLGAENGRFVPLWRIYGFVLNQKNNLAKC